MTGQNVSSKWVKQFGGISYDRGSSIALDKNENIYATGNIDNTVFISKFDSTGNLFWTKNIVGAESYELAVDTAKNIYLTGSFVGTVDFDPGTGIFNLSCYNDFHDNFIYYDVFVLKLDPSGNFIWAKQFGGPSHDMGHSIKVDSFGNVYTAGEFQDSVDFDPGVGTFNFTAKSIDAFISKLDASGNFIWAKKIGGNEVDWVNALTLDSKSNLLFTGGFQDTVDFNPNFGINNLIASAYYDMFVLKLDTAGNFIWAKRIGNSIGKAIAVDIKGNVHTTGYFSGVGDFDPSPSTYTLSSVSTDIFISKLDSLGNFIWAKQISGVWDEIAFSIAVDTSCNVYTTGFFQKITDFDPGVGTYTISTFGVGGTQDIFISKLDAGGNFVWAKQMGGTKIDVGNCIAVDDLENIYTTGYFNDTADFDPNGGVFNLISNGNGDVFLHRLSRGTFTGISEHSSENNIFLYPNPANSAVNLISQKALNNASVKIFSLTGVLVLVKSNITTDENIIDISSLADGLYVFEINIAGNIYRTKLLKN